MSMTAAQLRASAAQAERDAADALDAATDLARQETLLENRLRPVIDRHTDEVWMSQAASESRRRIRVDGNAALRQARGALNEVVSQLRRRADILEELARDYRREAIRLEIAEAAAADAAALHGIDPVAPYVPPSAADFAVPAGVR